MTWFKSDDKLAFHQKTVRAGNAAMGAWVRLGTWCADYETDGFAPADIVNAIASPDELTKLLLVGFLVALPDGRYEMHDFLKYNPSHAELEAKRAEWAAKKTKDRRRAVREVSPGDSPRDSRVCPVETPLGCPGTGTGSDDPDPESDPKPDSHRASHHRLKSVPPTPESVEPEEPPKLESGYDLARRVFAELWQEKYRRPFPFDPFDAGPKSEKRVLQAFGNLAVERGGARAEEFARHWVKAYLRSHGDRNWLDEHDHPARTLMRDVASYADPPAAKPKARPGPAETSLVSTAEQGRRASEAMRAMGKIGMGGAR